MTLPWLSVPSAPTSGSGCRSPDRHGRRSRSSGPPERPSRSSSWSRAFTGSAPRRASGSGSSRSCSSPPPETCSGTRSATSTTTAVERILALGPVAAIAASHPHMFGVQVEWSRRLGGAPVYVNEANLPFVARPDGAIRSWSGRAEPLPGVTLAQVGGHFPGSAVVHFTAPDGKGVLLSSDTVYVNPDRASVSFMRSFPNHIPLSPDGCRPRGGRARCVRVRPALRELRERDPRGRSCGRAPVSGAPCGLGARATTTT